MPDIFEITHKDLAGRIGRLTTPHGTVETPTIMPVINPNIQTIPAKEMPDFGARMIITNSYIIYRKEALKAKAQQQGLHSLLEFNGPIMTDSGSFQLSVYGEVEVNNAQIIEFQQSIGTDIGVPLDIPTPPDADYDKVKQELATTNERLMEALDLNKDSQMLLAASIQGGRYPDLREQAARQLGSAGFDIYPIGAVVPLMESYRYADLVDVIVSAKKGLPSSAPVHLFGAGHPMVFALAVALGCDLFDSAAYALYAKDGRYLTADGTYHIKDLEYLPCACPICTSHSAREISASPDKIELLARHNLYVTFAEINNVKQAIRDGNLWELVERRCRTHPRLLDGLKRMTSHMDWIEQFDPSSKSTYFYCGPQSVNRPEVLRWNKRLEHLKLEGTVLIRPGGKISGEAEYDHVLHFKPPFGAYPLELKETHPLNAEVINIPDYESLTSALENTKKLIQLNPDAEFTFVHRQYWEHPLISQICQMVSHSWAV
ncbi:MAG: tRNA guanosine(15) transglycosylase TgtA [Methanosarcinales archaeon]|nr:tRNA guanosine(15) transglycosylase TgtA [Methanosarcinales archaeon]